MLIEVRLELKLAIFLGLDFDEPEFFLVRLEISEAFSRLELEEILRRPSLVPMIEPLMALPEMDVPVGDDPPTLFPDDPGLSLGGGGGGPLVVLCGLAGKGEGSGQ